MKTRPIPAPVRPEAGRRRQTDDGGATGSPEGRKRARKPSCTGHGKRSRLEWLEALLPLVTIGYLTVRVVATRSASCPSSEVGAGDLAATIRRPPIPPPPTVAPGWWPVEKESEAATRAPVPQTAATKQTETAAQTATAEPERKQPTQRRARRLGVVKTLLVLALLAGLMALVAGGSTFAVFSAETGNPGNTFSAGTLTMSNQVNSQTVCNSTDAQSLDNYQATCDAILTLTNGAPGAVDTSGSYPGGYAKVTIKNTGSLDASQFSVFAPYVNARLSAQIASGATVGTGQTVTSFTVTPLEGPVAVDDEIFLAAGGVTQEFCAGAAAAAGATSITISGGYPAGSTGSCPASTTTTGTTFVVGTRLDDASTDTTTSNTDCFDAVTTSSPVNGATYGSQLNFNSATGNPLCQTALLWIQEQTTYGGSTYDYCWFGRGSPYGDQGGSAEDSNGQCRTPTTLVLASTVTAGSASYSLDAGTLNGNIRSGDAITLSEGGNTMTCTAAGTYSVGYASTIAVSSCSGGGSQVFDGSASVEDTTAFSSLNGSNPSSTISSFDTGHLPGSGIYLPPLTGNGTTNAGASVQLAKAGTTGSSGVAPDTRVFYVGVYLPAPADTNQDSLQGLASTFGLSWHIDQ